MKRSVTSSGAGASKSPKTSHLGKIKSKWSHKEIKILWECYIRSITPLPTGYIKKMYQLWVQKRTKELSSQWLAAQVRNIKSQKIYPEQRQKK